jgi:hypothetical protein
MDVPIIFFGSKAIPDQVHEVAHHVSMFYDSNRQILMVA